MKNTLRALGMDILSILAMPILALQIIFGSIYSAMMGILQGFPVIVILSGTCGTLLTIAMFVQTLHEGFWEALGSAVMIAILLLIIFGIFIFVMSAGLYVFSWVTSFFAFLYEKTGGIERFLFDTSTEWYEQKIIKKNMAIKILALPYHLLYIIGNVFAFLFGKALIIVSVLAGGGVFVYTEYYLFIQNPIINFEKEMAAVRPFLAIMLICIGIAAAVCCCLLGKAFSDMGNELTYIFKKTAGITLSEFDEAEKISDASADSTRLQEPILNYQKALEEFDLLKERLKPIIDTGKERDFLFEVNKLNEAAKNIEHCLLKLIKHYTKQKRLVFNRYLDDYNKICRNINEALPDIERKMRNPCYYTKYFDKCDGIESVTKEYNKLCKELHPNAGGDEALFILMKDEYNSLLEKMAS